MFENGNYRRRRRMKRPYRNAGGVMGHHSAGHHLNSHFNPQLHPFNLNPHHFNPHHLNPHLNPHHLNPLNHHMMNAAAAAGFPKLFGGTANDGG